MLFANNLNFPTFKHRDSMNVISKSPSFLITSKKLENKRKSTKLINCNLSFQTRFETSQNNISNYELKDISMHHKNEKEKTSAKKGKPKDCVDENSQIKKDLSNFRNFLAKLESQKKSYNLFVKKHSQTSKYINMSKNNIIKVSEKSLDYQKNIKFHIIFFVILIFKKKIFRIRSDFNLVHRRNAFERAFGRTSIPQYERMKKISSQLYENFKRYINEMKNARKAAKDLKSLCWNRPKLLKLLFKNEEALVENIDRFFFEENCIEKIRNLSSVILFSSFILLSLFFMIIE